MLLDESFESEQANSTSSLSLLATWEKRRDHLAQRASICLDHSLAAHGLRSMRITIATSQGAAGLANRGQFAAGLALTSGRPYEGYFFARSHTNESVRMRVALVDWRHGRTLAATDLLVPSSGQLAFTGAAFSQITFQLPPLSAGAGCSDDGRCNGEFVLLALGLADVSVDFVVLQPGAWSRFAGLPVLSSAVETLRAMGVSTVRFGGSFATGLSRNTEMEWERWRGPPWLRPSVADSCWPHWRAGHWHAEWCSVLSGWGPFEFLALAEAAGWLPVLATTGGSSAHSLANLVEYCLGNASSPLGRQRHLDGHPTPYPLRYIELGNEVGVLPRVRTGCRGRWRC